MVLDDETEGDDPFARARARLDALDLDLARLLIERVEAEAELLRAEGGPPRPDLQALALRAARAAVGGRGPAADAVTRLKRAVEGEVAALLGPTTLEVWGGKSPALAADLARARFGAVARLRARTRPEEALAAARAPGAAAVLLLEPGSSWWGRLLAEPRLKVFAALPELAAETPLAFAVGAAAPEPTGADETFWVTDADLAWPRLEEALGRDGLAARLIATAGGLKLTGLAGYVQADDARLARAPGRLTGVIGAAPLPFDL